MEAHQFKARLAVVVLAVVMSILVVFFTIMAMNRDAEMKEPSDIPATTFNNGSSDNGGDETMNNSGLTISESRPAQLNASEGGATAEIIDGEIIYSNAGSGSCPPIIDNAYYNEDTDTYTLEMKYYGNQACTMDYRPLQQTIAKTDGTKISQEATIEIR